MASPRIITGPPVDKVSREEAEAKLKAHPQFPKNASYALENVEGRWIAAITESVEKTAAPPDAFEDGGGAGDTPDGPPEPSEAPKGPDETPDSDDGDSDDKPKGDKKDKGESEKSELGEIKELLTTLCTALGIAPTPDSPIPGLDEGPPPPPPGDAPDAPGPSDLGGDGKTHTVHERALKPGEAPPGTTPIGSPSFASLREDHPWKQHLTSDESIKEIKLAEAISDDESMSHIAAELQRLAAETGVFKLDQLKEDRDNSGQRVARALVVRK